MPSLKISPLTTEIAVQDEYALFACALGYERRSRAVAESMALHASQRVAIGFTQNRILDYPGNLDWFRSSGYSISEPSDADFEAAFSSVIREITEQESPCLKICIDISSFSRLRIAIIVSLLEGVAERREVRVSFLYSGAEFSAPVEGFGLNVSSGPVTPRFAGWSEDPDKPPAAILGLGYEKDKAVGAVEYIEPAEVWAFAPTDHESEYSEAIKTANADLLETLDPSRLWPYHLYQPYDCFKKLESLVYGTLRTRRPVMLPFGPKFFMLNCLLVAVVHSEVSVWRFSSGDFETPINRIPNGRIACLKASLSPIRERNSSQVLID